MFAYFFRAISRAVQLRFVATAIAVLAPIPLGGCVGFLSAELNNRGGFIDAKLDERWMIADTKQMRVLRAYILIGSVARMAQPKSETERELIAHHINSAIKVAADAYNCAYSAPGTCIYFDERMVEAEVAVLKLLVIISTKSSDAELFEKLGDELAETLPLLKTADSLIKAVDAVASAFDGAAVLTKVMTSLLKAGKIIYTKGRRLGALYRDSIELQMVATLSSLDAMCAIKNDQFIEFDRKSYTYEKAHWATTDERGHPDKQYRERMWAMNNFYGHPSEIPQGACDAFRLGLELWHRGAGDLAAWVSFLQNDAEPYRKFLIPNENAFIQASDLIWRSCEHLTQDLSQRSHCIGRRGKSSIDKDADADECAVDFERLNPAQEGMLKTNGSARSKDDVKQSYSKFKDKCRLILYPDIVALRSERRQQKGANARIDWLSNLSPSPSHPLRYHPGQSPQVR